MKTYSSPLPKEERLNNEKRLRQMRETLNSISFGDECWLDKYTQWHADPRNQFVGILLNIDPFNLPIAGDNMTFDYDDRDCQIYVEMISMAFFICCALKEHEQKTVETMYTHKNAEVKKESVQRYFQFIETCKKKTGVNLAVVLLNSEAERQSVFYSSVKYFDSYVYFDGLREILRMDTTEAVYLQYTQWRITRDKDVLKSLLGSIAAYLNRYFYAYEEFDPEIGLSKGIAGLPIYRKLETIGQWIKMIVFHTEGIFTEYKKRNWLNPTDQMMDSIHIPNQISKFTMLGFMNQNREDDRKTVQQKANCANSYIIWVKTADVITIFCDIFRILQKGTEKELRQINMTPERVLEQFDYLCKLRCRYISYLFEHSAFYEANRDIFNPLVLAAEEQGAKAIAATVDDVLELTSRVLSDNIPGLMKAKQEYIAKISVYITEEQEHLIEEHTLRVAEKMKEKISKLSSFDVLYRSISDDFKTYAATLFNYPQILYSLVSAEYLYQEYILNQQAIQKFDYSCISILYYMALEDFVNKLVYTPYLNAVLIPETNTVFSTKARGYLGKLKKYVKDWSTQTFKSACELGPLGFLLEGINNEPKFNSFLKSQYPNIDIQRISQLGSNLRTVAQCRNDAAHGGNIISFQTAKQDKINVYESAGISQTRGLIKEFLEILI